MSNLEKRIEALEQRELPKDIEVWKDDLDGLTVACNDGRTLSAKEYREYVKAAPGNLQIIHVVYAPETIAPAHLTDLLEPDGNV